MRNLLLMMAFIGFVGFVSCKKTATRKACFTLSKKLVNPNDTVYALNCSENYEKYIWVTALPSIDSLNRHIKIAPTTPGWYVVALTVGDATMTISDMKTTGEIMIDSFKVQ
jgi:hypothetical protein